LESDVFSENVIVCSVWDNERVSDEDIVTGDVIPQINCTADANAIIKLEMEAHHECTEKDTIEAVEINFVGTLDEIGENDDALRNIFIEKLDEDQYIENGTRKIPNFKVTVKESEIITIILENWEERYNFDAFKNFNFENKIIRITQVERLLAGLSSFLAGFHPSQAPSVWKSFFQLNPIRYS
jgi:hypothetical protein